MVCKALRFIARCEKTPAEERLAFFTEKRHTYGRSALLASGGAIFGLYHVGVFQELLNQRLLPKIINGSSMGSIFAALVCALTPEEYNAKCA